MTTPMMQTFMAGAPAPHSVEHQERTPENDFGVAPMQDEDLKKALEALYGEQFPLAEENPDNEDWVNWGKSLWTRHAGSVVKRLHLVQRNRMFRKGVQWISATGFGPWKEPPKPRDAARVTYNMVQPALDQRLQIITEQRPGFETRPATQDLDDIKKAEAQQIALEYQWDQQGMDNIIREAAFWAGTDGVSFIETYWDPDRGPWHEDFAPHPETGAMTPMGPDGQPAQQPYKHPLGDVCSRVRRIEQVRVSAEASATKKPWYWVIRDVMPKAEAVREYGAEVAGESGTGADQQSRDTNFAKLPLTRLGYLIPDEDELYINQNTVDRITIYCEPSEYLAKGLSLVLVGQKLIFVGPLLTGKVPMVRFSDGSSDPAFYPTPVMENWIDSQMRVNAILSKWVENVRLNAGPRIIARVNSVIGETLIGGNMSVVEVKGLGSLNDLMKTWEGMSLAPDATALLQFEVKNFENLSGWNDTSRGQFGTEQSGRAILAIREQLERVFAPPVNAAAQAMTGWSKASLAWMAWGYDLPRVLGVQGKSRPDLAREITADDMDGDTDVWIDPETLMPMPRALRLFLLDNMMQQGIMSPQEYRRRMPFAWTRNLSTPDEDHEARARRVCEALRRGQGNLYPILWMDNEAIHQDVLERELLLPDDVPPQVKFEAFNRWMMLAQQSAMKMGSLPPSGSPPAGPHRPASSQGQQPNHGQMSPTVQPFAGTNPSVAAGSMTKIGGQTDANAAARDFDSRSQR